MNEFIKVLLSLSVSGTLLLLLILGLKPLYKTKFSKRWQYYIWIIAALRFLLPFTPDTTIVGSLFEKSDAAVITNEIPANPNIPVFANTDNSETEPIQTSRNITAAAMREPFNIYACLFFIWSALALVLFVRKITIYQSFIQYIGAGSWEVSDIKLLNLLSDCQEKLNIKTRVELSYNPLIASPMMIGFFRPRIVLPVGETKDKELSYIFAHELIHYKQRDMFYKWLIQIVVCAHWFNPFVYLLEKEVNKSCELSCDEKIISVLDDIAKREYGDTLISFMKSNNLYKSSLASVTLTEGAEQLKERLDAIMNFKKKNKWGIFISLLFTVMFVCGFTVSGAYAGNRHNQTKPNAKTDTVSLRTNSAEIIGFKQSEQSEEEQIADDSPLSAQMYDYYRTYEQTKADIQNGYIVNTGVSFSERAMPIVTGGGGTSFYVNHDNSINISISLKNLIDGTGHHYWEPITDISFVSFEVYDPSGKAAYSFYKEGAEIQDAVDIDTELAVYPGEWRYKINFAYTTNGTDPSDMRIALKYKTIYEDDIQWLVDNKLNKVN